MVVGAVLITAVLTSKSEAYTKFEIESSPLDIQYGADEAPLRIIMFMDYTCVHCKRFLLESYPKIYEKYIATGRVKFHLKLITFSNNANINTAYKMAICLNQFGEFEDLNDLLLRETGVVFSDEFLDLEEEFVNRNTSFAACMYGGDADDYLRSNLETFVSNQFSGTPTFIINKKVFKGYKSHDEFSKIIHKELKNL